MNPYQRGNYAYKKASVTTYDQGTLIIMLYEGAIKFLKIAEKKIKVQDFEGVHHSLAKTKSIISELQSSLNVKDTGEIGNNLQRLYQYMYDRLIDANINKDAIIVKEVIHLMTELLLGWKEINQKNKQSVKTRGEVKSFKTQG